MHIQTLYFSRALMRLADILNDDVKTHALVSSAVATWMLGYPEQAERMIEAAHGHVRRRGHPFDWCLVLTCVGAEFFDLLREPDEMMKWVEEGDRIGRENSLPFWTDCMVPIHSGIALIGEGKAAEGVASLKKGFAVWEEGGGRSNSPYCRSRLAEGMVQLGDVAGALALIDEAIAQVERPGWEERWYYAETLRIKGWLLSLKGDLAGAERSYLGAAHRDQLCLVDPRPGAGTRSPRPARAGLWLVHRRLRHQGSDGGQGAPRRAGVGLGFIPYHVPDLSVPLALS
jgi:hypothetical protein